MQNMTPVTREEKYLFAIATHGEVDITPVTTEEKLLDAYLKDEPMIVNPKTRKEYFVALATGATIVGNDDFGHLDPGMSEGTIGELPIGGGTAQ